MFDIKDLYLASSVQEAVDLLDKNPQARLISGGTDVLVKLRHFDESFQRLVSINRLAELKDASLEDGGKKLRLGAGLTFTETMNCELASKHIPVLGEASATVAGPQIRNMGTIGGNIANGATSADTAAPMLVLEPQLVIVGPKGERRQPIAGFHTGPGKVSLAQNELLSAFVFDLEKLKGLGACYYKYAMRSAMDIATIGCAAGVRLEGGVMADLRLAFTVAAPTPIRCPQAEEAGRGKPLTDDTIKKIVEALDEDIKPRTSWRATREFRVRIIKTLAERMIHAAAKRSEGGK